jgi:hypothetical protein
MHCCGRPVGAALVSVILLAALISMLLDVRSRVGSHEGIAFARAQILEQLGADDLRHLVMVRYGPHHSAHDEFVFNEADIDSAKVVWARSLDPLQDRRVLRYFSDRRVWRLDMGFEEAGRVTLAPLQPGSRSRGP